jgi:uncharacterized protein GlcG (DUF336 family)
MKRKLSLAVLAVFAAATSVAAFGQTVPMLSLDSEAAKRAAEACLAHAVKNDWRMTVSVVDAVGNLLYARRMDGAPILSVEPSRMKAQTALQRGEPSQNMIAPLNAAADNDLILAMQLNDFPASGGVPITINGQIVGAIGVGGGPPGTDHQCANVGIGAMSSSGG